MSFMTISPLERSVSSSALYTTWVTPLCSISMEKNSTRDIGMPLSTFFSELMDGLTLFFSIIEIVLLVTPARLASSRWDRPLSLRMACRRAPTSKGGILLVSCSGRLGTKKPASGRGRAGSKCAVSWQHRSVFTTKAGPVRGSNRPVAFSRRCTRAVPVSGCRTAGTECSGRGWRAGWRARSAPTVRHGCPGRRPAGG
ncbi:MAG: hypothetical protein GAK45_01461 [Pseudomonas citronellolis]|nr:MAG: hypothetical protein GAK45_01461 [Pseudomonas citronellolis]